MELDECVGFYVSDVWVGPKFVYVEGVRAANPSTAPRNSLSDSPPSSAFDLMESMYAAFRQRRCVVDVIVRSRWAVGRAWLSDGDSADVSDVSGSSDASGDSSVEWRRAWRWARRKTG